MKALKPTTITNTRSNQFIIQTLLDGNRLGIEVDARGTNLTQINGIVQRQPFCYKFRLAQVTGLYGPTCRFGTVILPV